MRNNSDESRSYVTYYNKDILAPKLSPQGAFLWMTRLPKEQVAFNLPGALGFKLMRSHNKVYCIFLDHPENKTLPIGKKPTTYHDGSDGTLTAFEIDCKNGSYKRWSILETKNANSMVIHQ